MNEEHARHRCDPVQRWIAIIIILTLALTPIDNDFYPMARLQPIVVQFHSPAFHTRKVIYRHTTAKSARHEPAIARCLSIAVSSFRSFAFSHGDRDVG